MVTREYATGICILSAMCKLQKAKAKGKFDGIFLMKTVAELASGYMLSVKNRTKFEAVETPTLALNYMSDVLSIAIQENGQTNNDDEESVKNAYQLLRSKKGDSFETVKKNWRKLCLECHTDKMVGKTPEEILRGREMFCRINDAVTLVERIQMNHDKARKQQVKAIAEKRKRSWFKFSWFGKKNSDIKQTVKDLEEMLAIDAVVLDDIDAVVLDDLDDIK